jgi:hypothetical protein
MKKVLVAALLVSLFLMGLGQARAYTPQPGWESDPYFTHQTWSFGSNATTVNADAGFINTTGTPSLTIDNTVASWIDNGGPYYFLNGSNVPYSGIWNMTGPQDHQLIATFTIPVETQPYSSKVMLNTTMQTNDPDFAMHVETNVLVDGVKHWNTNWSYAPVNAAVGVYDVTLLFEDIAGMGTSPATITITSNLPSGAFVSFDHVTIDTIPEPGTIAMVLAGGLALLGWAGLRRR